MKKNATFALLLVALTFAAGRAGATPVTFDYSFSAPPGTVSSGTGTVTFTVLPSDGPRTVETGATSILLAVQVFTDSGALAPGDSYNAPFSLNLHLTDSLTGMQDDLSFAGHVVGKITNDHSDLHAVFDGQLTVTKPIGGFEYTGTVEPADALLPAPNSDAGAVLDVKLVVNQRLIDEGGGNPPGGGPGGDPGDPGPTQAPEPSALLLGLSAAALVYLRRRKAS